MSEVRANRTDRGMRPALAAWRRNARPWSEGRLRDGPEADAGRAERSGRPGPALERWRSCRILGGDGVRTRWRFEPPVELRSEQAAAAEEPS